jgi:FMN phosphatase YigB (HAD superfamily)
VTDDAVTIDLEVPWPADRRLRPAVAALEESAFEVVSFDVFDTLLWRTVPEPVDAFSHIGGRLHALGLLAEEITADAFARLRQRAERRARERLSARDEIPEIGLHSIYDALPSWVFAGRDVAQAIEVEVEVERDILVADVEVAAFAAFAQHKHGARLVCVSDTYFSEAHVRRLLDRQVLRDVDFELVFVSNQYRAGKGTGIWEPVLERLGVEPARMLHIGDNENADVTAPEEYGIRTVHYAQRPPDLTQVLEREGVLGQADPLVPKPQLDAEGGDFGLTVLRSKVLALGGDAADNPFWRFGAAVLGPVFSAFASWLVEQAEAEGEDTVYCVMREGEFLSRIVDGAAISMGSSVRAKRLWLSRHVCARAALAEASEAEVRRFLARRAAPTVESLLEGLGVEIGQFPAIAARAGAGMDDPVTREAVLAELAGNERARAQIAAQAAALRSRLVAYVQRQTGGASRLLLADLGWGGTIQERLDAALAAAGPAPDTIGLYLLTNETALDRTLDGLHARGFLAGFGLPEKLSRWVIRSPEILEQVCMCDEGSMIDITADGEPVHGPRPSNAVQSLQRVALQQGIVAFQRERARYFEYLPAAAQSLTGGAREQLRDIVSRFVVRPTDEEAAIFGAWEHDENFGSGGSERLVLPEVGPSLAYMSPRQLLDLPMTALYWPFGAATTYNPPLAMAAAAIVDGVLPEEAFVAGDPIDIGLMVDAGGWGDAGPMRALPSASGRYLVRRSLPEQPRIRHLLLRFGSDPGVLRIDWLRLVFTRRDGDPITVHLDTPAALGQLRYRECLPLAPNIVVAPRRGAECVYRCPNDWAESAYAVDIEVAFGWMPTGPVAGAPPTNIEAAIHLSRRVAGKARNVWLNARQEAYGRLRG